MNAEEIKKQLHEIFGKQLIFNKENDEFKEVHLADHDYYNKIMKNLGLKKSSNQF